MEEVFVLKAEVIAIESEQPLAEEICVKGDIPIEEAVGELLVIRRLSIATAESCTGGLLAGRLINYPGISSVFMEGAVTYSNEAKVKRLGVREETLAKYGAVSEEVAKEMAMGIAKEASTDIGISVTGIAGPGGGTLEKPVGLVYVGIYINDKVMVKKYNFQGSRDKIRQRTVIDTLEWLQRELEKL